MKIAVFLDHDIVIRHFVLSGVLQPLCEKHDVVFVFPENHRRVRLDLSSLPIHNWRTIKVDERRSFRQRRLYQATVIKNVRKSVWHSRTRLRGGDEADILLQAWRDALGWRGYHTTRLLSWLGIYRLYRWWSMAMIGENRPLNDLLAAENPDLILHPTVLEGLFVSDLARWGKKHGVKTVYIMNSWDNPATKAMVSDHPDRLIVWGEHSENDAIRHMRTPPESIIRLGAAQYDVYRHAPRWSPEGWCEKLGFQKDAVVLLYAGSNQGLNETEHLLLLEEAIHKGRLNCFVVYRPHPWRAYPPEEKDFFSVKWNYVRMDPSSEAGYRLSRGSGRVMVDLADYEDTHSTLSAVDAVISPLSSILLEAALHGKPICAYVAGLRLRNFYHEFFRRVPCYQVEAPDRLVGKCLMMLRHARDEKYAAAQRRSCSYFVEPSDRPYGERLVEALRGI